ncbi:hypothetical protein Agub_g10823, partial [Astrephomene gubernaculifera]
PDHVRNPHRYTMYTLDEELVVGGGDRRGNGRNGRNGRNGDSRGHGDRGGGGGGAGWRGSGAREDADMRQALADVQDALAASERAEHDPERAETTFGSGIAFRPRTQRQQQQREAAPEGRQQQQEEEEGNKRAGGEARVSRGGGAGLHRGMSFAGEEDEEAADGSRGTG